jgi:single stranded DNA-binding protein
MSAHATMYGRLAFDPAPRTTRSGAAMTTARLAVDVTPKNAQEQQTWWVDLLAFGGHAEALGALPKGAMVSAMGRLSRGSYTAKNGETREQWTLVADSLLSAETPRPKAGTKANGQEPPARQDRAQQASMDFQRPEIPDPPPFDDDIPF